MVASMRFVSRSRIRLYERIFGLGSHGSCHSKVRSGNCCAQVTWVQPRVLTLPQIKGLTGRLDAWIGKVNAAALTLEEEAVGVAEA